MKWLVDWSGLLILCVSLAVVIVNLTSKDTFDHGDIASMAYFGLVALWVCNALIER